MLFAVTSGVPEPWSAVKHTAKHFLGFVMNSMAVSITVERSSAGINVNAMH